MQLRKQFSLWSLSATALLSALVVRADVLWITTEVIDGKIIAVVNYGHPNERETPDPHKLVDLTAYGTPELSLAQHVTRAERNRIGVLVATPIPMPTAPELIAARYDNGRWSKVGDTWFNADREMVPTATESDWSTKFAKSLSPAASRQSDAYHRVLGYPLELVPQSDPLILKPGDLLPVLVLLNGKPLIGGMVESTDGTTAILESLVPRYKSGPDGIAQVRVTRQGLQLLAIDYTVPADNPSRDPAKLYNATFSFVLQ